MSSDFPALPGCRSVGPGGYGGLWRATAGYGQLSQVK